MCETSINKPNPNVHTHSKPPDYLYTCLNTRIGTDILHKTDSHLQEKIATSEILDRDQNLYVYFGCKVLISEHETNDKNLTLAKKCVWPKAKTILKSRNVDDDVTIDDGYEKQDKI